MFSTHHMNDYQARKKPVFQIRQLFSQNHTSRSTVAIKQRERATRLSQKRGFYDRKNWRNATSRGEGDVVFCMLCLQGNVKTTHRRHHLNYISYLGAIQYPVREQTARCTLDDDPQHSVLHC